MQNIGINSALNAYQTAAKIVNENSAETSLNSSVNFKDLLTVKIDETANLLNQSEQISQAAIAGKADMKDVVTAVAGAEVALKTIVAVRDTMISAYQDILKMQI